MFFGVGLYPTFFFFLEESYFERHTLFFLMSWGPGFGTVVESTTLAVSIGR